jgi:hypothetical protein
LIKMRLLVTVLVILHFSSAAFGQRFLFYLHGQIVEDQGANAIDSANGYGAYQYAEILDAFRKEGFIVLSEIRKSNTDPIVYAHRIVRQIDSLIKKGVTSNAITVVGASKGAVISMFVSFFLKNRNMNFVFMAGCSNEIYTRYPQLRFSGNILAIYEHSDEIGRSCSKFRNGKALAISHYKEIELHTDLRHGFLYKPLPEWIGPVSRWANNDYK